MKIPVSKNQNKKLYHPALHFKNAKAGALLLLLTVLLAAPAMAQNKITVKGRVTAEKNQPVAGASVAIKGLTVGTSTDKNGEFQIATAPDATLVITSVGFPVKEVAVNNQTTLNITLNAVAIDLDQVVVIGYGTQKKRDVTGAVASVNEKTLKEVPAPNLIAQLKGRTPGVSIVSNGSTPGAGGSIRIRGNRTITNSQGSSDALDGPLLVLDGIPFGGSINDLDPDNISGVEILKDASATAIYGSRGAGGVILITTKRGRTGKAVISYDGYHGISQITKKYTVLNGPEYAQFKADAATYNRTSPGTTSYALTAAEQAALANGVSTDWQSLIYQNGFTTNHQLGISGGSENTQYGMGLGYYNETGIIPNQKFERYNIRTTLDHRISKYVKVGINSMNTLSYINTPGGGGVPSGLVRLTPLAEAYNADGTVNLTPAIGSLDAAIISPLTLKTRKDAILSKTRRLRTFNSVYGEVQLMPGLKYRLNIGLDYRQEAGYGYNGPLTYTNTAVVQSSSNASLSNAEAWSYNIQNLLYYDKTIADKHRIGFTALYEINKDHTLANRFTVTGVPADYINYTNFSLASGTVVADPNTNPVANYFTESGLVSYMGRLNYGYNNRYLLTATLRVDGSSTLAPGHQYFTYPAFGLAWNVMEEEFMKSIPQVSNLKLRGGWGISGNRNVAPYATLGLLSASTYNFGTSTQGQALAYTVTTLPAPGLGWQSTSQVDVGVDFGVLNNRISGSVDWYKQQTKDILLSVNLPISNGANSTLKNLGKTESHGIEVSLSTQNVVSKEKGGFTWSTDLNFFFNREKITMLTTPAEKSNTGNAWFVGEPLSVIYDYKKIGIWQTEDSVKGLTAAQTSPRAYPGQIRVEDVNGDGKIDASDRQIIGNFQPNWEGGLTNRFSYKGFDLSFVIVARKKDRTLYKRNGSIFLS